jgi:two-component system sensor histidine kinase BaeS
MRLGLTGKLFLALIASCLLVMFGTLFALHENFRHGFLDYVKRINETRVDTVATAMSRFYVEKGGWDFIRKSQAPNESWFLLLRAVAPVTEPEPAHGDKAMPPPGFRTHLWLLDENHKVLAGLDSPPADVFTKPIVASGKVVGWVASTSPTTITRQADIRFFEEQVRTAWRTAALTLVVAAIVAVILARNMVAPLKRLADTTHQLAAGNFHVRVPVESNDEMGRLGEDFNRLARALGNNEQMRRNFMADVSHELRTPLAILRGELEAIEDGVRTLTPGSLSSLQTEVTTLTKLVDDLHQLSLADIGALAYRKSEIDVVELIKRSLDTFRERFALKGIELDLDADQLAMVFGDPDRLNQLFNNLLENSYRYTDAGGRLDVACRISGQTIVLDFRDSAPGVPESEVPFLFDRFRRLESSRNRASGGSGLGLAICKSIVEAHDGQVEAKASPSGGLWMSVRLPGLAA